MEETAHYRAVALQTTCHAVARCQDAASARAMMAEALDRLAEQVSGTLMWDGARHAPGGLARVPADRFPHSGDGTRVAREGVPCRWLRRVRGPRADSPARTTCFWLATRTRADSHFPDLFFQVSFVIDPSGEVILRYRRLNSMFAPTPHDVWDRYVEIYGLDGVFPVVETEIGRLAAVASEEILYPEVTRCMAMRGAEVIVHSSCEISSPRLTPMGIARRARAIENMAYVVSCNTAGMEGIAMPGASADGGSMIVDFRGAVLSEAGPGESVVACAELDVQALRRFRRRPGMENLLARQRFEAYAESYRQHSFYPANTLTDGTPGRQHAVETQQATIRRLAELGVI